LLKWCKKRDNILDEIEHKLYEMKEIAEYALEHDLTTDEVARLNRKLDDKKREVQSLENQLQSVVH
jgi:predicted RNase H-like nuclease (RuvC/YqgF family)